jgi:hypothetical protein
MSVYDLGWIGVVELGEEVHGKKCIDVFEVVYYS